MKLVYFTVKKLQTVNSKTVFYECIFTTLNQQIQMFVLLFYKNDIIYLVNIAA